MIEEGFGTFLKGLREQKGLSLRDVADLCNFSAAYLSTLERGTTKTGRIVKASPDVLRELSLTYDYPFAVLMQKAGFGDIYTQGTSFAAPMIAKEVTDRYNFSTLTESVGDRIIYLLDDKGLTIQDLVNNLRLTIHSEEDIAFIDFEYEYIQRVIDGHIKPDIELILALSNFFNVSCDWLIKGREFVNNDQLIAPSVIGKKAIEFMNIMNQAAQQIKELSKDDPVMEKIIKETNINK
jgi:transcriptional regulator with XRE-family HTH domain